MLFCGLRAGYNEQLRISDAVLNQLPHLPGSSSDPSSSSDGSSGSSGGAVLELSEQAVLYLSHVFDIYDSTRSGVLSPMDLEHMFNRAPVPIYQVGCTARRCLGRDGVCFVSAVVNRGAVMIRVGGTL